MESHVSPVSEFWCISLVTKNKTVSFVRKICHDQRTFDPNPVFYEHTELTAMVILASGALLNENKKNPTAKCYPSEHWTQDLSHLDLILTCTTCLNGSERRRVLYPNG